MSVTSMRARANRSEAETRVREQLAAVYRVFARMAMDDLIYTHISARVPDQPGHFLINPFGLMYEEVTASNLVKVNLAGEIVEDSAHGINEAGFIIHSAVHDGAPNAHCVIHLHTDSGVAVSCQEAGLLPVSQHTQFLYGGVAYHDYEGLALDDDEKPRLVADLGDRKFLILRNHGTLTVGETVGEAFFHMYNLERACRIQVKAQASGAVRLISTEVQEKCAAQRPVGTQFGGYGEIELEAWMRKLDREGENFRD